MGTHSPVVKPIWTNAAPGNRLHKLASSPWTRRPSTRCGSWCRAAHSRCSSGVQASGCGLGTSGRFSVSCFTKGPLRKHYGNTTRPAWSDSTMTDRPACGRRRARADHTKRPGPCPASGGPVSPHGRRASCTTTCATGTAHRTVAPVRRQQPVQLPHRPRRERP